MAANFLSGFERSLLEMNACGILLAMRQHFLRRDVKKPCGVDREGDQSAGMPGASGASSAHDADGASHAAGCGQSDEPTETTDAATPSSSGSGSSSPQPPSPPGPNVGGDDIDLFPCSTATRARVSEGGASGTTGAGDDDGHDSGTVQRAQTPADSTKGKKKRARGVDDHSGEEDDPWRLVDGIWVDTSKIASEEVRRSAAEAYVEQLAAEAAAIRDGTHPEVVRRRAFLERQQEARDRAIEADAKRREQIAKYMRDVEMEAIVDTYNHTTDQARAALGARSLEGGQAQSAGRAGTEAGRPTLRGKSQGSRVAGASGGINASGAGGGSGSGSGHGGTSHSGGGARALGSGKRPCTRGTIGNAGLPMNLRGNTFNIGDPDPPKGKRMRVESASAAAARASRIDPQQYGLGARSTGASSPRYLPYNPRRNENPLMGPLHAAIANADMAEDFAGLGSTVDVARPPSSAPKTRSSPRASEARNTQPVARGTWRTSPSSAADGGSSSGSGSSESSNGRRRVGKPGARGRDASSGGCDDGPSKRRKTGGPSPQ